MKMGERWRLHDSAREMTKKYNDLVDEVNNLLTTQTQTEETKIVIDDQLSDTDLDKILGLKGVSSNG